VNGSGNNAYANSKAKTYAYINGTGGETYLNIGGNLSLSAKNISDTSAEVKNPTNVSVLDIQVFLGKATSNNIVEAGLKGARVKALGNVDIEARNTTKVRSSAMAGNSVAVVEGVGGTSQTFIGNDKEIGGETVRVIIGENTHLIANGDIKIIAENKADLLTKMIKAGKKDVALIGASVNHVATYATLKTEIDIGSGAIIRSENGSVTITANDFVKSEAKVDGDCIGIVISADAKTAQNHAKQTVAINIHDKAEVSAYKDVTIKAWSDADIYTFGDAAYGGMFAGGKVTAVSDLERTVLINIFNNAVLISASGNVIIQSDAGKNDKITTKAIVSAGGVFVLRQKDRGAIARVEYYSYSDIQIGSGAVISALGGKVDINSQVSVGSIDSKAEMSAGGVVALSQSIADMDWTCTNNAVLRSNVNIGTNGSERGIIEGKNISIAADLGSLNINLDSYNEAKGLGCNSKAYSNMGFALDVLTTISNTDLIATEGIEIYSDGQAEGDGIKVTSHAFGGGLGVSVTGESILKYAENTNGVRVRTEIKGSSKIDGSNVSIDSRNVNINRTVTTRTDKKLIGKTHPTTRDDFVDHPPVSSVYIEDGTTFSLCNAASKLEIIISDDNKGGDSYQHQVDSVEVIFHIVYQFSFVYICL